MPSTQIIFFGLGFASWFVGVNLLVAFHYLRLEKPWWSGFKPFEFPVKDFNVREWLLLLCVAAASILLFAIGPSLGNPK